MTLWPVVTSLIAYMESTGVDARVTSTLRLSNSRSFHSKGLAVDFAGPVPGERTPELLAIYRALEPLGPECLELIYDTHGWKHGVPYRYSAKVQRAHRNHVHVAMPADWRFSLTDDPSGREVRRWLITPATLRSLGLFRRLRDRGTG